MSLKNELKQHGSIGYGAMGIVAFYSSAVPEDEAHKLFQHLIDIGCTHWDSADVYGCGKSEEFIGSFLKKTGQREKVLVATKFGAFKFDKKTREFQGPGNGKPEFLRQMLSDSLERLGFSPDLYYLHRPDPDTPIEETVKAMDEERKAGKFRFIGLSEVSAETLEKAAKTVKIDALQVEVSPWTPPRADLVRVCEKYDIAMVAYSPIGRGFLTGRFKSPDDLPEGDFRKNNPRFAQEAFTANLEIVKELEKVAAKKNSTAGQISLAWLVAKGCFPIPGSTNAKRISENFGAHDLKLSADDIAEIDEIVNNAQIVGERYDEAGMKRINI